MCRLAQRERCAGWPIERALWRRPGHARCRTCRAPLAAAGSTAPKPPHQHRTQHQHAARHAAECCTGVQQTLRRCGAASSPNPRSRRAAARPSIGCRRCAPLSGSTECFLTTRSFAQRRAPATLRKADSQAALEAACGRPGNAFSPPPRPCPPLGRASSARTERERIPEGGKRRSCVRGEREICFCVHCVSVRVVWYC